MDEWDKFNEKSIPSKESFYSNLTMENINEKDYIHASNVFKTCKLNNLGGYHDLYVKGDTLLLADIFENFRKVCIETSELDSGTLHIITMFSMASMFKKNRSGIGVVNRL